ncbi:MAG: alpha/beta hydrolase [Eubacteriales bacterium]|nr:alpha/beta hydrolase [Eubacteriales bacterium]
MKKKKFKVIGIILGIVCLSLLALYVNHRIQLSREQDLLKPLGKLVEVDGKKMSIYTEGSGEQTIIFMSGSGTCSPILDFKSLYASLSDEYKIVVVEKFGYGFSDITDASRDIDTILENTRTALIKAEVSGPYVLCPHSMSGIEALYWAQKYPSEVSAIIGLDMSVPKAYENMQINIPLMKLLQFSANIGVTRIGNFSESAAIINGNLTDEEKDIYRALFFIRTLTNDMLNEAANIKSGAEKVGNNEMPQIPILLFCSDGSGGTGYTKEQWQGMQADFAKQTNSEIIYLDCGHYIHDYEYSRIADEIKFFLD